MNRRNKIISAIVIAVIFIAPIVPAFNLLSTVIDQQEEIIGYLRLVSDQNGEIIDALNTIATPEPASDTVRLKISIHHHVRHYRDGVLILEFHHPATVTTLGLNWIEDQLGDSPSTDPAKWIGNSNSSSSPSAAWIVLPSEITTGGMARAAGTYVNDGTGDWNITKTFSPTETNSTQLSGLYYAVSGDYLLASDTLSLINYENGDTIVETWMIAVT